MREAGIHGWLWTRREYEWFIESGFFELGDTPELIDGLLTYSDKRGSRHTAAVALVAATLGDVLGSGWSVMAQRRLTVDEDNPYKRRR